MGIDEVFLQAIAILSGTLQISKNVSFSRASRATWEL